MIALVPRLTINKCGQTNLILYSIVMWAQLSYPFCGFVANYFVHFCSSERAIKDIHIIDAKKQFPNSFLLRSYWPWFIALQPTFLSIINASSNARNCPYSPVLPLRSFIIVSVINIIYMHKAMIRTVMWFYIKAQCAYCLDFRTFLVFISGEGKLQIWLDVV